MIFKIFLHSCLINLRQHFYVRKRGEKKMPDCKVIAVANQKGRVGKTTTTFNLRVALAINDKKVLLVDSDPEGDLTTYMGYGPNDFELSLSILFLII